MSLAAGQLLLRQRATLLLADIVAENSIIERYSLSSAAAYARWQQRVKLQLPQGMLHMDVDHFIITWGKVVADPLESCTQAHTSCLAFSDA